MTATRWIAILSLCCPAVAASQSPAIRTQLQRILVAEDARGTGADGITPLVDGLRSANATVRAVAARGIGRLQRPELGAALVPLLVDRMPNVRIEAANALAQTIARPRRAAPLPDSIARYVRAAQYALTNALETERNRAVVDAVSESLGRLPLPDSVSARAAELAIHNRIDSVMTYGQAHGLYKLAAARRALGPLTPYSLRTLATAAMSNKDARVRRLAVLTLTTGGGFDSATAVAAFADSDDQVRRLVLAGSSTLDPPTRQALLQRGFSDTSAIVRIGAIAALRPATGRIDCAPLVTLASDSHPYVALSAIDALGNGCIDVPAASAALQTIVTAPRIGLPAHAWQRPAHALVALAQQDSARAQPLIVSASYAGRPGERAYAARAATATRDAGLLTRLADDPDDNVREAALSGLQQIRKHSADSVYIAALSAQGYQVVLQAATALAGTPDDRALPAVFTALDRLSAQRHENARDPRIMLLRRIGELGSAADSVRVWRYVTDFDTTIASMSAALLTRWTGKPVTARPAPLPVQQEQIASSLLGTRPRVRVTLDSTSGGGDFVVELLSDVAPATVARLVRLVRTHWYDGHQFQRVEPNFVVQGGGPGASEYVGYDSFIRDELGLVANERGTIGMSARGRDTGDAQWYVNLTDNSILDHEYTIFARVVNGQDVAERIQEGDVIARMTIELPVVRRP